MISKKMQAMTANSSVIRAMFEEGARLAKEYGAENVFDFSIGNPSVTPPPQVAQAICDCLEEEPPLLLHGYMNNSGYESVRAAIANHLNRQHGCNLNTSHIVMTCGAAGGLNVILKTLLDPGDEVIVLAPFFGEYANYISNFEGKMVVVNCCPDTFQPDLALLEQAITAHTKAIILNTPNNPSGVIYPAQTLRQMAELLRRCEQKFSSSIYVISDEPYREIVYDAAQVPFMLDYFDNAFIGYSYSKSLSLPGERIGYIAVNPKMDQLSAVLSSLNVATRILGFVNAPSLFQKVVARILDVQVDVSVYQNNRDRIYNHLTGLGFQCVKPQGAFYLFPQSPLRDEKVFCELAKQQNILVVPGSSFGCPGHFRLSYCVSPEQLERSLPAFERLWEACKTHPLFIGNPS